MDSNLPDVALSEHLANTIAKLDPHRLPPNVRRTCEDLLVDCVGLCVTVRNADYIKSSVAAFDDDGLCTAIGHAKPMSPAGAAFVNGTAIHGEDFDDTFEGGPVHAGAVIVPAVLAACERHKRDGGAALLGIAVGVETMCRLSLVAPTLTHKAGFHPTAVLGAVGAAAGVGAALKLDARQMVDALGNVGSMASGIIEYLAEGAWTKRLHPGWAAQSGLRAALLGRAGFTGPRTVFEGVHGLFNGFAHTTEGDYAALLDGFGERWLMTALAFKPYPCGTMIQPYVDCARRLAKRIGSEGVVELVAQVAEGTVHRLWEPLAEKQQPPNGYAAKFSAPYCIAAGLVRGNLGLDDFTDGAVADPAVRALAAKVRYEIDAANPYPFEYTGHLQARLPDGRLVEERQPHLRGGAREPLTRADLEEKLRGNARVGGWPEDRIEPVLALTRTLWDGGVDLTVLRG